MADDTDGIKQRVAESVTMTALSRLVVLLGVPLLLMSVAWGAATLVGLLNATTETNALVRAQQRQLDGHEIRINRLEQKYFTPGN
jgi:hypothetical protein